MKLLDIRENAVTVELEQQDCRVLAYACAAGSLDGRRGYEARDVACAAFAALFDAAGLAASAHGKVREWLQDANWSRDNKRGRAGYEARDLACTALAAFFDAAGMAASAYGECLSWGKGGRYSLAHFRASVDVGDGEDWEAPPAA